MSDVMTDKSLMPFGKHKGKPLAEVPAGYFMWLFDQDWLEESHPDLFNYIIENMEAITKQSEMEGWDDKI